MWAHLKTFPKQMSSQMVQEQPISTTTAHEHFDKPNIVCGGLGFFTWSAALGKILTMNNLEKQHVIVMDRYCLCKRNGESADHLLHHCDVAFAIWIAFL